MISFLNSKNCCNFHQFKFKVSLFDRIFICGNWFDCLTWIWISCYLENIKFSIGFEIWAFFYTLDCGFFFWHCWHWPSQVGFDCDNWLSYLLEIRFFLIGFYLFLLLWFLLKKKNHWEIFQKTFQEKLLKIP